MWLWPDSVLTYARVLKQCKYVCLKYGVTRLPNIPRPKQKICVIGDAAHNDEAEGKGVPHMSADDLKKLNKDKV